MACRALPKLLKQVLWFSQQNGYHLAYLTTYPDQEVLIQILEYFGFQHTLTLSNGEFVYEKPLSRQSYPERSSRSLRHL
jgi:hypothetical protein